MKVNVSIRQHTSAYVGHSGESLQVSGRLEEALILWNQVGDFLEIARPTLAEDWNILFKPRFRDIENIRGIFRLVWQL